MHYNQKICKCIVSKIFAIVNALQSKNHALRNAFEKSPTITIAHKNLILEIGYTYYGNSLFLPRIQFTHFFPKINSLKTNCAYFFFGQVEISSGK